MNANQDDKRRRRRRRRRAAAVIAFLAVALGLAWFFESQATTTVIFVRYAEIQPDGSDNPGLSPAGQRRAQELVRVLKDVDVVAGVDAIYANRFRNTQETAQPLATQLDLPVRVVDSRDIEGLTRRILREHKGKIVLVVTNRTALPMLIRELHGSKKVPAMADTEHDNLYIVSIPWYGKVKTLRLKYGEPYIP